MSASGARTVAALARTHAGAAVADGGRRASSSGEGNVVFPFLRGGQESDGWSQAEKSVASVLAGGQLW